MRLMAMAVALVAVLFAAAPSAFADSASCDIYEIEASNDGSGIDGGLSPISKPLRRPPFNSWKSHKLLKKHNKSVEVGKSVDVSLTAGSLDLAVKEVVAKAGKKTRLRIGVVLTNKQGKDTKATTEIDSGDAFLIGGEPLPGKPKSAYFVGIACTAP